MNKAVFSGALIFLLFANVNADWLQFRGNPAQTGVASGERSKALKLLWTFDAGSEVSSTPALTSNYAYLGTGGKKFYSLNLSTGKKAWEFASKGEILSSALALEGKIYFGDDLGFFYALDENTGKELWRFEAKDKIISSANFGGNGVVFGSYDGSLYFLDRKDGKIIWKYETESPIHGSPAVFDNHAVSGGCDGILRFINLSTGKEDFNIPLESNIVSSSAAANNCVYISSLTGKVFAADTKNKKILWEYFDEKNEQCYSSPLITGKNVIFGTRGNFLRCLSREDGKPVWSFTAKEGIDSSPVLIPGDGAETVYFGSTEGKMYGVNALDGKKIFEYDTGSAINGSLAVSEGKIVFGTAGGLVYCFTGDDKK